MSSTSFLFLSTLLFSMHCLAAPFNEKLAFCIDRLKGDSTLNILNRYAPSEYEQQKFLNQCIKNADRLIKEHEKNALIQQKEFNKIKQLEIDKREKPRIDFLKNLENNPFIKGPDYNLNCPPGIDYPSASRRREEEGKVRVGFRVSSNGDIQDPIVLESSGHAHLDIHATDRIIKCKFVNSDKDSSINSGYASITFEYRLID